MNLYEKISKESTTDILERLWTAVCSNKLDEVKDIYNEGLIKPNTRYERFGNQNSLIMGALRNGNYDMVDLLKSLGESIRKDEVEEYKKLMAPKNYEDDLTRRALNESDEETEFDALGFEKKIPHNMRFKTYDIITDPNLPKKYLYWVTQCPFNRDELEQFQQAFKDTGLDAAYVTLRDLSGYDFWHDKGSGVLAEVGKHGYNVNPYIDSMRKKWEDFDFDGEPYKSLAERRAEGINEAESPEDFRRNFSSNLTDYINKALSFKEETKKEDLAKLEDITSSFKEDIAMVYDDFIEYIHSL